MFLIDFPFKRIHEKKHAMGIGKKRNNIFK